MLPKSVEYFLNFLEISQTFWALILNFLVLIKFSHKKLARFQNLDIFVFWSCLWCFFDAVLNIAKFSAFYIVDLQSFERPIFKLNIWSLFVHISCLACCSFTAGIISLERFYAIARPLQYGKRFKKRSCFLFTLLITVLLTMASCPPYISIEKIQTHNDDGQASFASPLNYWQIWSPNYFYYFTLYFLCFIVCPYFTLLYYYTQILQVIALQKKVLKNVKIGSNPDQPFLEIRARHLIFTFYDRSGLLVKFTQILFGHFLAWAGVTILIFFKLCKLDLNDYLIGISLIFNSTILITHPLIYGLDNWKIDDENSPATIFEYVPEQNLNVLNLERGTDIEPDEIRRKMRRRIYTLSSWAKVNTFWFSLLERKRKRRAAVAKSRFFGRGKKLNKKIFRKKKCAPNFRKLGVDLSQVYSINDFSSLGFKKCKLNYQLSTIKEQEEDNFRYFHANEHQESSLESGDFINQDSYLLKRNLFLMNNSNSLMLIVDE